MGVKGLDKLLEQSEENLASLTSDRGQPLNTPAGTDVNRRKLTARDTEEAQGYIDKANAWIRMQPPCTVARTAQAFSSLCAGRAGGLRRWGNQLCPGWDAPPP